MMSLKQFFVITGAVVLSLTLLVLLVAPPAAARALPEYAEQTGEPCSSCHLSASGGGPRGARGQAWVASNKPGVIPGLIASLELLGVELNVDPAYFTEVRAEIEEAGALETAPAQDQTLFRWLSQYDGN